MTVQTPSPKHDQHFKPSRSGAKVQIHFPEEVKTSRQVRGKDTTNVKVTDSVVSHGYKVVKTSVWDHIKASLLSRKYGGTIATVSLSRRTITEPVVGKPVRPTLADSDVSVQLPQSFVNTEVAAPLTSEGIKHTDSTRPIAPPPSLSSQARSTQSLYASQGAATSLSPETIEWMSKATAGYVGMKVYRPPGRAPLGHELDWMRPNNEPPELPNSPPVPVPLAERRLADVTMSELGPWLVDRIPQSPREGVALVNNSWQWYYRRYIDVRKGGVGGIGMLLAGYCLLSYVWCYPHLKHERWRKYH
ncbi:uncharacterized protein si:dkey-21c1.4 [Engraulis encrasicolus]|uniref:uncharacterized protein si:dkey-21c1.4 n=1 Tax=Engraulis encrasicolus TaxID=184585 RepID=UPI002FD67BDA